MIASSLHRKLPLIVAATAITTVTAFGVFAYRSVHESALAATETRLQSTAGEINGITALGAVQFLSMLDAVAKSPAVIAALAEPSVSPRDSAIGLLRTLEARTGTTIAVDLLDRRGFVRASTHPSATSEASPLIVGPHDSAARVGPFFQRDGLVLYHGAAPVRAGNAVIGEVRVTRRIGVTNANQRIATRLLGPEAVLLLGNRDGSLWAGLGTTVARPAVASSPLRYERDGRAWISAAVPMLNMPWALAVELPESVALAPAKAVILPFILAGALVAFVGAVLGAWVSRTMTRPLLQLTTASEAITRGDLAFPEVPVDRGDEIGRLARAFAAMSAAIRGSHERLEGEIGTRTGELRAALGQLREAQEDLLRNERLAAIGQLAGSIGHELRNPLAVMTNAAYLIEAQPDASPTVKEYVVLLREQIRISQRIISDLLSTVHSTAPVREPVDVAAVIDGHLRQAAIPSTIRVERYIAPDLPMPVVDRDQIGRILLNLLTNAVQAMEGSDGTLTVRATATDGRLSIEVADTGPGIPGDVVDRIFEPLFTTKARGIGLGLPVALAMAQANGGNLQLQSGNGRGARFVVDLPVAEVHREPTHATPPAEVVGAVQPSL